MSEMTREEVNARLEAGDARTTAAIEAMRADVRTGLTDFRAELANMRAELAHMRGDIHQVLSSHVKWIVVFVFGALATAGTAWRFLN